MAALRRSVDEAKARRIAQAKPAQGDQREENSMSFNVGDRVLVNGGLVATIKVYDEVVNQLVYTTELPGGATNDTYGHISNTNLELLDQPAAPQVDELPLDEDPKGSK